MYHGKSHMVGHPLPPRQQTWGLTLPPHLRYQTWGLKHIRLASGRYGSYWNAVLDRNKPSITKAILCFYYFRRSNQFLSYLMPLTLSNISLGGGGGVLGMGRRFERYRTSHNGILWNSPINKLLAKAHIAMHGLYIYLFAVSSGFT